ncbi:hypothetical protein K1719_047276 [Acacia pycnantha]|nr:hypothetical protein K1719_047276 [Acacia pycnantha]
MFTGFMKLFQDTQVQVRLAAFNFMATPTIFVQLLQLYYHSRLLPAFVTALDTEKKDKVKEQVASAILYFLKNTLPDSFSFSVGRETLIIKLLVSVQVFIFVEAIPFSNISYEIFGKRWEFEFVRVRITAIQASHERFIYPSLLGILSKLKILLQHPNQPLRVSRMQKQVILESLLLEESANATVIASMLQNLFLLG